MKTTRLVIEKYEEYYKVYPHSSRWTYELRVVFKIIADLKTQTSHWRINNMQ